MSETDRRLRWPFVLLAVIGGMLWLLVAGLHVVGFFTGHTYEIDHTVLLIGFLFGFVGFFGLDAKRAKEGGAFIIDSGVKIMRELPRFGRRSTDALAVPDAETTTKAVPVKPPPRDVSEGIEPTP